MGDYKVPNVIQARLLGTIAAILREKAEQLEIELPPDESLYAAQNFRANAVALSKAMRRVIAHSSVAGTDPILIHTQRLLQSLIREQGSAIALDSLPDVTSPSLGKPKAKAKFTPTVAGGEDFVLCLVERKKIGKLLNHLQVNMREQERDRLAKRDAYERELERRSRVRH